MYVVLSALSELNIIIGGDIGSPPKGLRGVLSLYPSLKSDSVEKIQSVNLWGMPV